jgi:uncharacterized protein with PQ loop repeat
MPRESHYKLKQHVAIKPSKQLEKAALVVAIAEPLMTIPQILQIYVAHNTGTSIVTWALYLIASIVWLIYGLKTRNIPILVTAVLWVIVEAIVVVGILTVH